MVGADASHAVARTAHGVVLWGRRMTQRGDGNGAGVVAAASESRWPASNRAMGIGVILPIAEDSAFGGTPHFADILAMTRTAEDAGFDAVWIIDHLVFRAQPGSQFQVPSDEEDRGVWECFTTMAALASATERIQIGSLVACTGFRNPGLVAKMTETIDDISGGRVILGLGAGWHEPEYDAFGFPFDHRVSRFEEALAIIEPLLRGEHVDLEGEFFQARDAVNRPRGPRPAGVPILVGSTGAPHAPHHRSLRRCLEHGLARGPGSDRARDGRG